MSRSELALALRRLRSAAGMTQEDLADRAGISARAVSDIERGTRRRVYPVTARQLATALDLPAPDGDEFERIARGRPAPAEYRPSALPAITTSLVGRRRELAELSGLLAGRPPLLVTVTGAGGVGKTRLAAETARACAPAFEVVHWVRLDAVSDPALVGTAIARTVGADPAGDDLLAGLVRHLGTRRTLLVLDTFEHVRGSAPDVAALVDGCPALTVLVTSRARLGLYGEREFALGPLSVPGVDAGSSPTDLLAVDAVRLFVDRALAARRDVTVDPALVATICRHLQGLPLAIELAAARSRHLSLADLAIRLRAGSGVLTGGPGDLPDRQSSMRATVGWSYRLLDPEVRRLLRRLAAFGDWTLEQAEQVCGWDLHADVLDTLSTLVDHSLVTVGLQADGTARYRMSDVVREYAGDEAERSGETYTMRSRHAAYFVRLAAATEPALRGTGQHAAHLRLDAEIANLRAAQEWLLHHDRGQALRLAGSLWMFWLWRGGAAEGRTLLARALGARGETDDADCAKALWGAGWLAFHQGDVDDADRYAGRLARLAARTESPVHLRNALTLQGMVALARGDHGSARSSFAEARRALAGADEPWLAATSLLNLGIAKLHAGDLAPAERDFVAAAQAYAGLGDRTYLARADRHLGAVALIRGERDRAEQLFAAEFGGDDPERDWGTAESLEGLAWVAAERGDADASTELAAEAAALRARFGIRMHPLDALLARRFRG